MREGFKDIFKAENQGSLSSSLLYKNNNTLKNNPKAKTEYLRSIDYLEGLDNMVKGPLEQVIFNLLLTGESSPKLNKSLKVYGIKFLKISAHEIGKVNGEFTPKVREIESILRKKFGLPENPNYLSPLEETFLHGEVDIRIAKKEHVVPEIHSLGEAQKQRDLIHTLVEGKVLLVPIAVGVTDYIIDEQTLQNYILKKDRFSLEGTVQYKNLENLEAFLKTPDGKKAFEKSMQVYSQVNLYTQMGLDFDSIGKSDKFERTKEYSENINSTYLKLQTITDHFESERHRIEDRYSKTKDVLAKHHELGLLGEKLKKETKGVYKEIIKTYLHSLVNINPNNPRLQNNDTISYSVGVTNIDINLRPLNKEIEKYKKAHNGKLDIDTIEHFIDGNIDKFFVDGFIDNRFKDIDVVIQNLENNKAEVAINVLAVITGAVGTGILIVGTKGQGAIESGLTYTAIHDTVRSLGYGALYQANGKDYTEGLKHGVGYSPNSKENYAVKKGFEIAGNIALFGIFELTGSLLRATQIPGQSISLVEMEKQLHKDLKSSFDNEHLGGVLEKGTLVAGKTAMKVGVEGTFFTGFQMLSASTEEVVNSLLQSGMDKNNVIKTFKDKFKSLAKPENLFENLVYNMAFIATVRGGLLVGEKVGSKINEPSSNPERRNKQYIKVTKDFSREVEYLQKKGLTFEYDRTPEGVFTYTAKLEGEPLSTSDPRLKGMNYLCNRLLEIQFAEINDKLGGDKSKLPHFSDTPRLKKPKPKKTEGTTKEETSDGDGNGNSGAGAGGRRLTDIKLEDFVKGIDFSERDSFGGITMSKKFVELAREIHRPKTGVELSRKINEVTAQEIETIQGKIDTARTTGRKTIDIIIDGTKRPTPIEELQTVINKIKDKMGPRFEKALDKAILDKKSAPEYLKVFAERVDKKVRVEKRKTRSDIETRGKDRRKF